MTASIFSPIRARASILIIPWLHDERGIGETSVVGMQGFGAAGPARPA